MVDKIIKFYLYVQILVCLCIFKLVMRKMAMFCTNFVCFDSLWEPKLGFWDKKFIFSDEKFIFQQNTLSSHF